MLKKGMFLVISVIMVFVLLIVYWNIYDWETTVIGSKENVLSSWHYELNEMDSEKAIFSYGVTLYNDSNEPKVVRTIQPSYKNEIKIIEHDNAITVNKKLQPNEKYEVNWDIIVDTKEITELNVKTVKAVLESVTIAMDKSNYTYYQN
ncbi:hypothetical protein HZF24_11955 [Sedimentibacter hydroxybenzoicus DSM 7310]|uniref:Uncharacterized protein n=1 Tax=Sedimentibacter hydroxybenzoicus DSM 7310 TaxID=1123245 RepID=A0A974BLC9_SEDHY|nr:hypothetical protein [Sedimentibacter hydroxybenzoicus]NYB74852.1 hypothetical protein [Sedimentibacter hydroxybenzoicus DSM 7310]